MNQNLTIAKLYSILLLSIVANTLSATEQEKDLLIYEGARYFTYSTPSLGDAFPGTPLPDFASLSTGNYKGYRASWAIIQNQLYLLGIEGRVQKDEGRRILNSLELFPEVKFPYKLTEYSGSISLEGRSSDYEVVDDEDIVKTLQIEVKVKKGVVVDVIIQTINRNKIARKKGMAVYETSLFKEKFAQVFNIYEIQASNGKTYGGYSNEIEWSARLSPKIKCAYPCTVKAKFPVNSNNQIETTINPIEINEVLKKSLNHPFVLNRFEAFEATGIRLRIAGNRLHWNTEDLQSLHRELKGVDIVDNEIRTWAFITIDDKQRRYTSFYFNDKTGEIMYRDYSGSKVKAVLVSGELNG